MHVGLSQRLSGRITVCPLDQAVYLLITGNAVSVVYHEQRCRMPFSTSLSLSLSLASRRFLYTDKNNSIFNILCQLQTAA